MTFAVDWTNKVVNSDAGITDIPLTREELRALEDSEIGILYPPVITYKELDLGGGAKFPAIDFINGYQLKFPTPGNYLIKGGNLNAIIVPVSGVFVDRTQSAAYAVSSEGGGGGGGLTPEESQKLMSIPSATLTLEEHNKVMSIPDIQLTAYIKNKKYLEKVGNTWYLVIKDDNNVYDILRKALKDKDGQNVKDLAAGVFAQELKSSV